MVLSNKRFPKSIKMLAEWKVSRIKGIIGILLVISIRIPDIYAQPTIHVHPQSQNLCFSITGNESVTLTVSATGSGTLSYQWYKDNVIYSGATSSSLVLYMVNVNAEPPPSWYCKVTDNNGSTNSNSAVVTAILKPMKPNLVRVLPGPVCPGNNITLQPEGNASVHYDWYYYAGSCGGTLITHSQGNLVTQLDAATTYYVRGENACGVSECTSATATTLSLSTEASSISATESTICSGEETTLTVVGGSLGANGNWRWYSGSCGGTYLGSGSSYDVSPTTTTTYYVRAEGSCNTTSCKNITITVNPIPGKPATSDEVICEGEDASLSATGTSLKWYDDLSLTSQVGTGSPFNTGRDTAGILTYYVTQTVNGCESLGEEVNLTIHPVPRTNVLDDQGLCDTEVGDFQIGSTAQPGHSCSWTSSPAGFTSSEANPTVSPDTNVAFYLIQTIDSTGCHSVDTVQFTIYPSPVLELNHKSAYIHKGEQIGLSASGAEQYEWSPGTWLSNTTGAATTAFPVENISYTVTGSSAFGCIDRDTIHIFVYCKECKDTILFSSTGHFNHGCINNNYNNNDSCSWMLYPSDVSKIYLYFDPDSFDIRPGDWVRVYNGTNSDETLLGEYNNDNPPEGIIEGGSTMFIQLITDDTITGTGFQAMYTNDPAIGITEQIEGELKVYPNPGNGIITIELKSSQPTAEMELFNTTGQKVLHRKVIQKNGQFIDYLDITWMPEGIYYLRLRTGGRIISKMLIVQ
jgi:hypothetical protein